MKSLVAAFLAVQLVFGALVTWREAQAVGQQADPPERSLVGQVLLPSGEGRRGVELWVTVTGDGQVAHATWVQFDARGYFSHPVKGTLTDVSVNVGGREVYQLGATDLSVSNDLATMDIGDIDLRDRLVAHRLFLRPADGSLQGEVRVGMWFEPPPVGPRGEPVSLGSAQFPPVELGTEMEWLLPREEQSIYFLVERPVGSGRGREWRSGHQRLFGPFAFEDLPTVLVVD